MSANLDNVSALLKALEAGNYNAAPSTLVQGAALQVEDLSPVIYNTTFEDKSIKLQKIVGTESCKSMLAQFDRQLSYGHFGGSAQLEGNVGIEATSDFARVTVPMCFYSHTRRVTYQSMLVTTVDGKKSDERAASDGAKKISADIEFDLFCGCADFSNAGVFDGNPLALPLTMANIRGVDLQIRQSDILRNAQDLMFNEYGSDGSVVIAGGGTLTQDLVEDASVRSAMNHGNADMLVVDPIVLSNYNKLAFGKERIVLAGSATESTGSDLRKQWVSGGTVNIEASRFLSGKTRPADALAVSGAPTAPVSVSIASTTVSGTVTTFVAAQTYPYFATSCNEIGESRKTAAVQATVSATGDVLDVTITHPASGTTRFFNVYRGSAGGAATTAKYIGRITVAAGAGTTVFRDLNNAQPGFVTGYLLEGDTMVMKELAPFSRMKLAQSDLSLPEVFFRFTTLAVTKPRANCVLANLR